MYIRGEKPILFYKNEDHLRKKNSITMTSNSILALVVSGSGTLQNGLLALVTTIPPISAVLVAEDVNSALKMVENHHPGLIILDMSLPDMQDVIKQIKEQCPHVHLIVLVEDTVEEKEVEESGVDSVLLKGFSAHKLIAIVENLIDRQGALPQVQTNPEG